MRRRVEDDTEASETMKITFFVPGIPAPGGSKRAVAGRNGKALLIDDCKRNKPWRDSVASAGIEAMDGNPPMEGPLSVQWVFLLPRPKHHFGTGRRAGILKPSAPRYHASKPDITKLIRSAEDALTHIAWTDDAAIAEQTAVKRYTSTGESPGVMVEVSRLPNS